MKQIIRTVTKQVQETVQLCDTCGEDKPLVIEGNWNKSCRYDFCYDDHGRFEFCSVACFVSGAQKALDDIGGEDGNFFESFSIRLDNNAAEFAAFVTYLKGYTLAE